MARKRRTTAKALAHRAKTRQRIAAKRDSLEDSAIRGLSQDEIRRLSIDAWEPSLLRHMLEAENKLRRR